MHLTRANKKKVFIYSVILIVSYTIFSSGFNKYQIDTTIKNVKPEVVWEFVADFSKMKLLNPTILDFTITADHGNIDHWKYSVAYTERLSHWPYWINKAIAHISVRKLPQHEGGQLTVESEHQTCFFAGLYCLISKGDFKISAVESGTYCLETVYYQCPPFMSRFCRREVEFQRQAIMNNLQHQFNKHTH